MPRAPTATPVPEAAEPFPAETVRVFRLDEQTKVWTSLRWLGVGATVVFGLGVSWALLSSDLKAHANDSIAHLDRQAVQSRGGPVYQKDLWEVKEALGGQIKSEAEATRALIRNGPPATPAPLRLTCRSRGGAMRCESLPAP